MNTRFFTTSCGVTLILGLTACGGGGGDSAATPPVGLDPAPVVVQPEPEPVTQTADIVVSDTFSFQNKPNEIAFEVDVSADFDYVTVCSLTTDNNVNLNNCMLRAPLFDGRLSHTFPVTLATENLGAIVWDYEALNNRQQHIWSIDDGLTFAIN